MIGFRKKIMVGGHALDVTAHDSDSAKPKANKAVSKVHTGCGGLVVRDADSQGDWWWNYRCKKCEETFQDSGEWLEDK